VRIEGQKDGTDYLGADLQAENGAPEEKELNKVLNTVDGSIRAAGEDFAVAMSALATLRAPVDAFFDKVTVNSDQAYERVRRLSLLGRIVVLMNNVADFGAIEG
jgi:glycyl-tRNA synthetase beta chain